MHENNRRPADEALRPAPGGDMADALLRWTLPASERTPADELAAIAVSVELDAMHTTGGHSERTRVMIERFAAKHAAGGADVGDLVRLWACELDLDASTGGPRGSARGRAAYDALIGRLMPGSAATHWPLNGK